MTVTSTSSMRSMRLRPLAACLAVALAAGAVAARAGASEPRASLDRLGAQPGHPVARVIGPAPAATLGTTHVVTTCDDQFVLPTCDGVDDGTLRQAFFCAQSADTIDLTQLTCSVITLSAPLLDTDTASTLTLQGPGRDLLTIDGAGVGRVLNHKGGSTLYVNDLTITNGHYQAKYGDSKGGCIYSFGSVVLSSSTVSSCQTTAASNSIASGGAIFAKLAVILTNSTVTGGSVDAPGSHSAGGGIWAGNSVLLDRSTVSDNTATAQSYALGGGIYTNGNLLAAYSTISGNGAGAGAGSFSATLELFNSTISGNAASSQIGGAYVRSATSVYNSTIAMNTQAGQRFAAGLYVRSPSDGVTLESSIIAHNTAGADELDLGAFDGGIIAGSNNLIMTHLSTITIPTDTISNDPRLGPLQNNGGSTQTHALLPGSPAIDRGDNSQAASVDQRGYARVSGNSADIGAFEADYLFVDGFDPRE